MIQIVSSGVLMNRKVFYFSLLSIAISGCSSVSNKQASGDFDYATKQEAKEISVPVGLKTPAKKNDFFVENNINHKGPVGKDIDVRAPSLVLPVAASSRVETNNEQAKIWFDQVLDNKDLEKFIYQAVQEQLESDGVALDVIDAESKIFESQWYNDETESGFWFFETVNTTESMRFRYQLETKPHGRSVALIVTLVDYMKTDSSGGSKEINLIDKTRVEMAMLNEIVSQVDYKYRSQQQENRLMRANQQLVSFDVNAKDEPAYIVEMELDSLWSNMPIFFENYGFNVSDLNETKKIYYVDFVKPDISLWDKLWGDNVPELDLTDGKYQFILAEVKDAEERTSVTLLDENGAVLSHSLLEKLLPLMEPGLSFKNIY